MALSCCTLWSGDQKLTYTRDYTWMMEIKFYSSEPVWQVLKNTSGKFDGGRKRTQSVKWWACLTEVGKTDPHKLFSKRFLFLVRQARLVNNASVVQRICIATKKMLNIFVDFCTMFLRKGNSYWRDASKPPTKAEKKSDMTHIQWSNPICFVAGRSTVMSVLHLLT